MKKRMLLFLSVGIAGMAQAQRFFYVEPGNIAENTLKEKLLKASQFIVKSPLVSDYTIKMETQFQAGSPTTTLSITLQDSATSQTIFQTHEEYRFGAIKTNPQLLLNMAMQTLIKRNIDRMILCAKNEHRDALLKTGTPAGKVYLLFL